MQQYNWLKIPVCFCLLAIFALPLVVTNDLAYIFITGKNFTFRVVVELLFALYLLLMLYDNQYQPKFSWILVSFVLFLFFGIISAINGVDPQFSFLGSYLRMDGIVTLVHLFMYFIVLSHVIKTQEEWSPFLYVSILVALAVALHGIISNDPASTLGNPQFSGIYYFFNIFFIALLITRTSTFRGRYILGLIAATLIIAMFLTGERGIACAALFAGFVSFGYILRNSQNPYLKYFLIALILIAILLAILLTFFSPDLIYKNQEIMRYFDVELYKKGISIRAGAWGMALKGFKDHPILGWGINNFTYVFNKYYNSFYCHYDMWMDRVHNNYLEWLVVGGLLGFVAYVAFLFTPIIYIFRRGRKVFNVYERAILLGLMSGYLILNMFYFDTITSYIYFVTVIAFIHAQCSKPFPKWELPKKYIAPLVMPIVAITTALSVYYGTVPSLLAAHEAMIATNAKDLKAQYQWMHQAWNRNGIGNLDIVDKFNPIVLNLLANNSLSPEEKLQIANQTEAELKQYIESKPRDPRAYYLLILLSVQMRDFEKAKIALNNVWLLTPKKEYTRLLQGVIELDTGHLDEARNSFKASMCLERAQELYNVVNRVLEQQKVVGMSAS